MWPIFWNGQGNNFFSTNQNSDPYHHHGEDFIYLQILGKDNSAKNALVDSTVCNLLSA